MKKVLSSIYHQLYSDDNYNKEYSDIYKIHKYWSRKPWYLVEKYIIKHTKKNETVLDPFMGSGCTGVESFINDRNFIGYDLNPISIKIAEGTSEIVDDIEKLKKDFEIIKEKCFTTITELYKVNKICPNCGKHMAIKYICIGPKTKNKNLAHIYCPYCQKKSVQYKEIISYKSEEEKFEKLLKKYWQPNKKFPEKFYKDRFSYKGIKTVSDMYTKRNLYALCFLRDSIKKLNLNYPDLCKLAFTNTVLHSSKLNGENVRPLGVNSYWIPDDYIEENVWFRFEDRFHNVIKSKIAMNKRISNKTKTNKLQFHLSSCLNIKNTKNIDYIFTDPPYGDAIQYSELSYMYNAWIDEEYDIMDEVIINPCQNKKEKEFFDLIDRSLEIIYQVLKQEGYFTLCFQNKDFNIWRNIIEKCKNLGFKLNDISIYDTYGNPYNKSWAKFSPKADIYVTFKKTDYDDKSKFFCQDVNLEGIIDEVTKFLTDKKDNNKIYDLTVAYIIWMLFYNTGKMNIEKFDLKTFIKYIEKMN